MTLNRKTLGSAKSAITGLREIMQLNSNTKLGDLLSAIPSAASVCDEFHIPIRGNEDKSLERLCSEVDITFTSFLWALDNVDWDREEL